MQANFPAALAFVWRKGFDAPDDGYHTTPHDPGGGTNGGVTEATWRAAQHAGTVPMVALAQAANADLSHVLHTFCWGQACDDLPAGLDLMVFNGRMMTGHYAHIFQQCGGLIGTAVDGDIGTQTLAAVAGCDVPTLISALHGVHYAYLSSLDAWPTFRGGWTQRLIAVRTSAVFLSHIRSSRGIPMA